MESKSAVFGSENEASGLANGLSGWGRCLRMASLRLGYLSTAAPRRHPHAFRAWSIIVVKKTADRCILSTVCDGAMHRCGG